MDLPNMIEASEMIARSAIERKESRGAHFRDDFPDKTAEGASFNSIIKRGSNGEQVLERVPVTEMTAELKQIIEEMK